MYFRIYEIRPSLVYLAEIHHLWIDSFKKIHLVP